MASSRQILLVVPKDKQDSFIKLEEQGFVLSTSEETESLHERIVDNPPSLLMLDLASFWADQCISVIESCNQNHIPVLGIVRGERKIDLDTRLTVSDLLFYPFTDNELTIRVNRLISNNNSNRTESSIRIGSVFIDLERYEVTIAGRKVVLTYKEYQLLCLMANAPGRVYSREVLLSTIWGYDYFGGIRTVDVHIRRLRSKIEDSGDVFIETVRNVGYRFSDHRYP